MNRLIDANDLRKQFDEGCWNDAVAEVDAQPTAYDVESVVRELEEERNGAEEEVGDYMNGMAVAYERAIEIVKRGGRNE